MEEVNTGEGMKLSPAFKGYLPMDIADYYIGSAYSRVC
jgi:hypothetical protein